MDGRRVVASASLATYISELLVAISDIYYSDKIISSGSEILLDVINKKRSLEKAMKLYFEYLDSRSCKNVKKVLLVFDKAINELVGYGKIGSSLYSKLEKTCKKTIYNLNGNTFFNS